MAFPPGVIPFILPLSKYPRPDYAAGPLARAAATPLATTMATVPIASITSTTAPVASITAAPELTCTDGSTILSTIDCTMGTPTSYCHKPEPRIECPTGFYPGLWHPGHCVELQTCYPLDASWIATECSNGAEPWSTSTLYEGTLAGGQSTVVTGIAPSGPYQMQIVNWLL